MGEMRQNAGARPQLPYAPVSLLPARRAGGLNVSMADIRIGISGWRYAPWRGVFYPKGLPQKRELEYAASKLNSLELNGSFYSLQRPENYASWHEQTPADFVFAIKGPRFITHIRRLRDAQTPLANFFASGLFALKEKLGPILWQLPPNFVFDAEKVETFLALLPRDTAAAAALSREHDQRLKGRALTRAEADRPLRYAMEVRHESFATKEFIEILRRHRIALVVADTAGKWPYGEDMTADFTYARLHGDEILYASGYTDAALDRWARRLTAWSAGKQPADTRTWGTKKPVRAKKRDVFVYFDNDVKVKAPFDAMALAERMGVN
jgi:uncharacterized protein YecE (DUF72 family)